MIDILLPVLAVFSGVGKGPVLAVFDWPEMLFDRPPKMAFSVVCVTELRRGRESLALLPAELLSPDMMIVRSRTEYSFNVEVMDRSMSLLERNGRYVEGIAEKFKVSCDE